MSRASSVWTRLRTMPAMALLGRATLWAPVLFYLSVAWLYPGPLASRLLMTFAAVAFLAWDVWGKHVPRLPVMVVGALIVVLAQWVLNHTTVAGAGPIGLVLLLRTVPGHLVLPVAFVGLAGPVISKAEDGGAPWAIQVMLVQSMLTSWLFLFSHIPTLIVESRRTQEELARLEVDSERDRLAQRLNTLMGNTLRTVDSQARAIRAQLDPAEDAAARHLDDVTALTSRGMQQLEALAHEPVVDNLDDEIDTARVLCQRMGITFRQSTDEAPDALDHTLALLLRESVTNMFKHATPTRCTLGIRVEDGRCTYSFVNDGAPENSAGAGTGQERWRDMLSDAGGTVETEQLSGQRYRVLAHIPVGAATSPTAGVTPSIPEESRRG